MADGEREERYQAASSLWYLRQGIPPLSIPSFDEFATKAFQRAEN